MNFHDSSIANLMVELSEIYRLFFRSDNIKDKNYHFIQMTSHNAIRDSVVEMSRRVGRHNLDVPEMKALMERIERSQPGVEFTNLVRQTLAPVSHLITVKNIDEIAKNFPDFPLKTIVDKVPVQEQDAVFQALGMTNMLLTTLQMVPPEMLNKIESLTNTMMLSLIHI